MKPLLVKLVLIFTCFISLNAEDIFYSVYDTNSTNSTNLSNFKDFNDTNLSTQDTNLTFKKQPDSKSIFLSYEETPKRVYVGEVFTIKVKAIIATDEFEELKTSFYNQQNLELLNPNSNWKWFSDNIFYNTFYFKADSTDANLPDIELSIYHNDKKLESEVLKAQDIDIVKLNGTKFFSGVIAESLNVKKYKTTQFDDKNYIIVLELLAKNSNLKDFKLKWVIRDGIDSQEENLPFYKIYYYAIIPDYTKKFDFTYFNSIKNKFEKISLPVVVTDDKISTQIDLNPAQSSLQVYKDTLYGIIAISLLILLIRRKKVIYLLMLIGLVALFVYDKNPFNSIKIEKGTHIKILPTQKSTVFYITNRILYASKLDKKGKYTKVLLPNGKIGWIKDKNDSKN